ncbi:Gamma-aminobutyric acid receptor subunit beta-1 [Acropora cervicornis]|uniref:Gamma-aminobutyric acid receptor subunit beta-1 n=1 Tax=Acropora cervicornis TaxID=6130 RepID=A0AAD9R3L4_ACRCE|nr:Gamma-aminobutyric acid receptor subunit beta-1 [Acropora cervicornis]
MLKQKQSTMATIEILVTFLACLLMVVRLCSGFSTITNDRQERSLDEGDDDWRVSQIEAANLSAVINEILASYDPRLRPYAGGKPVEVTVEIKVVSLAELNEANMDYSMDVFFRQWWLDPRFKHNSSTPFNMAVDPTKIFWTPDTYFFNVKSVKYHFVTHAHTTDDIDYKWRKTEANKGKGIEMVSKEMAQFEFIGFKTKLKKTQNSKGSFASLTIVFSFKRRLEFFISSVFTPAVTLVVLSWCCFWIDRMAIPTRVSLGITAILTIIILCGNVNAEMPPVSYIKAQDYFLLGSFAFIFMSFVEFVIVLNTHPDPRWFRFLKRSICRIRKSVKENSDSEHDAGLEAEISQSPDSNLEVVQEHVPVGNYPLNGRVVVSNTKQAATVMLLDRKGQIQNGKIRAKRNGRRPKPKQCLSSCTHWVDLVSRVAFPASYATFLVLFWRQFVQPLTI